MPGSRSAASSPTRVSFAWATGWYEVAATTTFMDVEIWSDIACPWCYVGKRRFEAALATFAHRDDVTVTWRSFELDPEAPAERPGDRAEHLAAKYGITRERAVEMQDHLAAVAAG